MKQHPKKALSLVVWIVALAASGDTSYVREDELVLSEPLLRFCGAEQAIDLSPCWTSVEDLAKIPLSYSSVGWGIEDLPGESTVRLDNVTGAVFNVQEGLTGRGVFPWVIRGIDRKVFHIQHVVTRGGVVRAEETLNAIFDYTDFFERNEQIKKAVVGHSQALSCRDDTIHPWSLLGGAGEGVSNAADGAQLSFSFAGAGSFSVELAFASGSVVVMMDGVELETVAANAQWTQHVWPVVGFGRHTVTLRYSGTSEIRVRNAVMNGCDCRVQPVASESSALDLRRGVRKVRRYTEILPFTYSSTNWIGDVVGVTAASVARVTIVQLTGSDPDVVNWTEMVPGTFKELVKKTGEGEVKWRPKQGVWKATFDILNDDKSVRQESAILDLRNASGCGLILMLR